MLVLQVLRMQGQLPKLLLWLLWLLRLYLKLLRLAWPASVGCVVALFWFPIIQEGYLIQ